MSEKLLDRHNDEIVVHTEKYGKLLKITDDYYTIKDNEISGVVIPEQDFNIILNQYGVIHDDGELFIFHYGHDITSLSYKQKVHNLRSAMHKLLNSGANNNE